MDCRGLGEEEIREWMRWHWDRAWEFMRDGRMADSRREFMRVEKMRGCLTSKK